MRVRSAAVVLAVAAMLTPVITVSPAASARAGGVDGMVWNILSPGQSGSINATELPMVLAGDPAGRIAVHGRNAPPNFADQLERYDAFNTVDPATVTAADLDRFYKRSTLEVAPGEVARVERPKRGVTITWDRAGVPHVVGTTATDVAWGAGYAGTRDRMFVQDVLRHAGAARAAEFLGPAQENIEMDMQQLRTAHYTPEEAGAQVTAAAARHGGEGAELLARIDAYLAGINAAQAQMCPIGLSGPDCPVEYAALTRLPRPWSRADFTYIASLMGGIFGKGGGSEYANALWLQRLQQRFGADEGRLIFDDLRFKDDAQAPTTSTRRVEYGEPDTGVDPSRPGVALPDLAPAGTAPGSGQRLDVAGVPTDPLAALAEGVAEPRLLRGPSGVIDLGTAGSGMSNAALLTARRSATGHPIAVFGPQTGYFTPQLLTEISLVGPGITARGVAFAGTNFLVQFGHGKSYAWSATSSSADNVDTVVERLCDPDGSTATVHSEHYLRDGACVPMQRFTHTQLALPTIGGTGAPQVLQFLVLRTHHGIVQARTTVHGAPVAVVTQRSTYGKEVDSIVGFARFNDPGSTRDTVSFQRAAAEIDYTLNWFYADSRDISHYSSGLLPLRAAGVDFDLPRWGDAAHEWQGFVGFTGHARQTNPPSGYLVSWNNKPAPGFAAADNVWGYGPVHRSQPLTDRVRGARTPEQLTAAVQDAATVDARAERVLPVLLAALGDVSADPRLAEAVAVLAEWGGHREDRDRDGAYTDQAAIALFDQWWAGPSDQGGVGLDVLRGTLGELIDQLPHDHDDHPNQGLGSAFDGVAGYGHVVKDLSSGIDPWHRRYCGSGDRTACAEQLRASLLAAMDRALAEQGARSVRELSYNKHADDITPVTAGVVGTRRIDWQNRPTFQQIVAFTDT